MKKSAGGNLSDQVREAIRRHGSMAALARDAGVAGSMIGRFASGERTVNLNTLDKLAGPLGLKLITTAPRRKAG